MKNKDELIGARYQALAAILNERQRRLYAAVEAKVLGHGGVKRVWEATGVARCSILAGLKELRGGSPGLDKEPERIRQAGAGRKKLTDKTPTLRGALECLVEPTTRGDPQSQLRWTCKSVRRLAGELERKGHHASHQQTLANLCCA